MSDFFVFVAALLVTYLCAVGFVIVMVKVFFPLKTKDEWEKVRSIEGTKAHRQASGLRPVSGVVVVSGSRQLA
ncbi:MAG: hypothetical protein WKF87_17145 [Chryseolinea sp.]